MSNDVAAIGGAFATAATAVVAGVTFGQVKALNDSVVSCAKFTAKRAEESVTRHVGETVGLATGTAATGLAAGVTFGQVDTLNRAVVSCANKTTTAGGHAGRALTSSADALSDGLPVVGHVKGGILYACGQKEAADRAMKSASRTIGVVGGGVAGFVCAGPMGAVGGGIAGGAAMDGVTTGVESAIHREYRPNGQVQSWTTVVKAKNAEERIGGIVDGLVTPLMDGAIGLGAGKAFGKLQGSSANGSGRHLPKRALKNEALVCDGGGGGMIQTAVTGGSPVVPAAVKLGKDVVIGKGTEVAKAGLERAKSEVLARAKELMPASVQDAVEKGLDADASVTTTAKEWALARIKAEGEERLQNLIPQVKEWVDAWTTQTAEKMVGTEGTAKVLHARGATNVQEAPGLALESSSQLLQSEENWVGQLFGRTDGVASLSPFVVVLVVLWALTADAAK